MTLESLVFMAVSAGIGWVARHYGLGAPANAPPLARPQSGGAVLPPAAQADLPSLIASIVSEEVKKGIAYLESRLPLQGPPAVPPLAQTQR